MLQKASTHGPRPCLINRACKRGAISQSAVTVSDLYLLKRTMMQEEYQTKYENISKVTEIQKQ